MNWLLRWLSPEAKRDAVNPASPPAAVEWPSELPPLQEYAASIREKHLLPAALLRADRKLTPTSPQATWLGTVLVGVAGETWPLFEGVPMVGICQINLEDSPVIPEVLSELGFISIFMARGNSARDWPVKFPHRGHQPGQYVIRSYPKGMELVPYEKPGALGQGFNPCAVTFEIIADPAPHYEEPYELCSKHGYSREVQEMLLEALNELNEKGGDKSWGTKVGGWPAPIQDPNCRPLAFQLGCENNVGIQWIDGGCVYVWRNSMPSQHEWDVDIEFY